MSIVVRALDKFFISILPLFFFQLTNSFYFIGYKHAVTTALEMTCPRPVATNDNHHMMMKTGMWAPQQRGTAKHLLPALRAAAPGWMAGVWNSRRHPHVPAPRTIMMGEHDGHH
jgi:hypothetical protein